MASWIIFVLGLVAMIFIFYLAVRFITGDDMFDISYFFRLLLASLIVMFIAPFFQSITPGVLSPISTIIAFVIILYSVRFLLVEPLTSSSEWEKTIWISLLAVIFVYVLNAATVYFLDTNLVLAPF